jgi:glycosyl transferase family 11
MRFAEVKMNLFNYFQRKLIVCIRNLFLLAFMSFSASLPAKPFIEGHMMGQFGNQLFIIAATTSLALDHDAEPRFPTLATSREFNIPFNHQMVFHHLNSNSPDSGIENTYIEPNYYYEEIPYQPNMKIVGWFQSEKYFINHKDEILTLFAPHPEIMNYLNSKYSEIINNPKTVSIHLRTYDVEIPEVANCYITYGAEYVEKAMELFPEDSLFVVFSNQMKWCKQILQGIPKNMRFIEKENYIYDFYLMSLCKHNIICNSSFSWWSAYLNKNPDKIVVVPPLWFSPSYKSEFDARDLIPDGWTVLKN